MTKQFRVLLLAENDADAGLTYALSRPGESLILRHVDSSGPFIEALREFGPHLVLIDDSCAQLAAGSAIGIVQEERPTAPIIVIMNELNEVRAVSCLRAGADAFVLRANSDQLKTIVDSALLVRKRMQTLTGRQLEVLRRIAEGQKTREIASDLGLSVKTVETHRSEIKKRLKINELAGLVRYAARVGLVPIEAPEDNQNVERTEGLGASRES